MAGQRVATTASDASAAASPKSPETDHGDRNEAASDGLGSKPDSPPADNGFAAAVAAVMALPLTSEEQAEAVRRLLGKHCD